MQEFGNVVDGECVCMGSSTIARVMGKRKILLKFTSSKLLSLNHVLYMSSLCKNLVSGILLNNVGLKIVVADDEVVISHNKAFVAKGYLNRNLFVLNLTSKTLNGNASTSAYTSMFLIYGMVA